MIEPLLKRLQSVKPMGHSRWMARCPAHDDKNPSLAIKELSDGRILMKCFAGCSVESILSVLNLSLSDLFPDGKLGEFRSFQRLENDLRASQEDKYSREKIILAIADSDRAQGKRLSPEDLQRERQAYMRLRKAGLIETIK